MQITEKYIDYTLGEQISVIAAKYLGAFNIRLFFSNGCQKLVDFKPFLESSEQSCIQKYLDKALFTNFKIVEGNLNWNDFELYFPIEDLYFNTIFKEKNLKEKKAYLVAE